MGPPVSGVVVERYLKYFEELSSRRRLGNGEILYYIWYVDDIIIFDQNKTKEDSISENMNNVRKYFEFILTEEEISNVNYLDVSIRRLHRIYRGPTQTDTIMNFMSNHPLEHILAVDVFYIFRMLTLPI